MDRSIFNLTKYSIFHYLHCTDKQMNTHYSSALRPPLCHRRGKKENTVWTDGHDDTLAHTRARTHAQTHTRLLRLLGSRCSGGGEQMICRKT